MTIHFVRGREGLYDVDIILGRGYLMMMLDYKDGRGVKNLGKSDYVISECSFIECLSIFYLDNIFYLVNIVYFLNKTLNSD